MPQEMLPAKPVFFRYVAVLCGINAAAAVGACLLGLHAQLGYCLYGLAELLYNALLPPVRARCLGLLGSQCCVAATTCPLCSSAHTKPSVTHQLSVLDTIALVRYLQAQDDLVCEYRVQLLYATFLRDFFAAEEVDDELFLMEMRDGGFLGDGSEEEF